MSLRSEIFEQPAVIGRLLQRQAEPAREIARSIRSRGIHWVLIAARGSSDHAATYAKYLIETRARVLTASAAPSVSSVYGIDQDLRGCLFLAISQSGRSPDLVAATRSARTAGARTVAIVNATSSPVADQAEFVVPIEAGQEHSVAATKTVIGSMAAGAGLIAELAEDHVLRSALSRLPERLHRALALDWSEIASDLSKASAAYVAARGLGLGSAREIALKFSEILRLPSIGLSAAELQHGPRAALSSRTPVLMMRLMDETAAAVDALAEELREQKITLHLCGGPRGSLPWLAEDDPATDPITMLTPAYRIIEKTARACGFDPDRPPRLSKITETF